MLQVVTFSLPRCAPWVGQTGWWKPLQPRRHRKGLLLGPLVQGPQVGPRKGPVEGPVEGPKADCPRKLCGL